MSTRHEDTYAHEAGQPRFNWRQALSNPPELASAEHIALTAKARVWQSCACGRLDARIERDPDGIPIDYILHRVGGEFAGRVHAGQWDKALACMDRLERREQALIADPSCQTDRRGHRIEDYDG